MLRAAILAAFMSLAGPSQAAAQLSVGVGIEFGGPTYYGPPPIYYGPPPVYVYQQPPAYYAPAPPPVVYAPPQVSSAVPPDVVFDELERAGYRELGPMAFRDGVYKLSAVNRDGDLVALEVSVLTGSVESETLIGVRRATVPHAPPPPPQPARPPGDGRDPLVVY